MVAVNLAVLIALLLLAEGVLRWADYPFGGRIVATESALGRFDDQLGWSYRPGLSRELDLGGGPRGIHVDARGIRVPSPDTRLDPAAPSILFVGGSYTMGHGLAFEESFVGRVGTALAGRYQVVNLGVQAYGTDQSYLALQRFADAFDTRMVVYTFIEDHMRRNATDDRRLLHPGGRFLGTKPRFVLDPQGALQLAATPVPSERLPPRWHLPALLESLGLRTGLIPRDAEDVTRALVRAMHEHAAARDAGFVLLNWRWQAGDYDGFDDLGVAVIDTLDAAPPGWGPSMQITGWHPDATASAHAAEVLLAHVRRVGLD